MRPNGAAKKGGAYGPASVQLRSSGAGTDRQAEEPGKDGEPPPIWIRRCTLPSPLIRMSEEFRRLYSDVLKTAFRRAILVSPASNLPRAIGWPIQRVPRNPGNRPAITPRSGRHKKRGKRAAASQPTANKPPSGRPYFLITF